MTHKIATKSVLQSSLETLTCSCIRNLVQKALLKKIEVSALVFLYLYLSLVVSHAFKKAYTEEDHKLLSDEKFSGIILKHEFSWHLFLLSLSHSLTLYFQILVQRVFRLAGTVSKQNDKSLSQEILV